MSDSRATSELDLRLKVGDIYEEGQGEIIAVTNPTTGEVIAELRAASEEQVRRAVDIAHSAFKRGELGSPRERSEALHRLADIMESRSDEILDIAADEVGTPLSTAPGLHLTGPIRVIRYYAEAALVDRTVELGRQDGPPANDARILYKPVGVVAGIAAYNYPLMFAAMKMGAAFAAGCPTVMLSSPHSPLALLQFAHWADAAGIPSAALSSLAGGIPASQSLIGSPHVAKVSFTGSVPAGTAVMKLAADGLRDVVLELGGKSAAIILPSQDAASVVASIHARYLRNAGQGCASPTRILVPREQYDAFRDASREYFDQVVVGDPKNPATLVGPVISESHRRHVLGYIEGAVADGGEIIAQGSLPDTENGWWVRPTLIAGLPNDATINQEEVFGPVATVQVYDTIDEAVEIANDSVFGLHASIFGPVEEALALSHRFDVGIVTINGGGPTRTDAPNGGWKQSGIGRERGDAGMFEFLEPVQVQWPVGD